MSGQQKTEVRPLDAEPAGLALPEVIDQQQRLKPENWRITGVSLTQRTADLFMPSESMFTQQVEVGLPELSATLLPQNPAALQELKHMTGCCFFIGQHLFRIYHCSLTIGAAGELCGHDGIRVDIDAQAIWRQKPERDSHKGLPVCSLP